MQQQTQRYLTPMQLDLEFKGTVFQTSLKTLLNVTLA